MKTYNLYYKDNNTKRYLAGEVLTSFIGDCNKWVVQHGGGTFVYFGIQSNLKKLLKNMNLYIGEEK